MKRQKILTMVGAVLFYCTLAANSSQPSSAPDSKPEVQGITRLEQVTGTYIEVIHTDKGFFRTSRCGPDDRLIFAVDGKKMTMRWSSSPNARDFLKVELVQGEVILVERSRTVKIRRVSPTVIKISFERSSGRVKSYLYGELEPSMKLPLAKPTDKDDGCAD